MKKTLKEMKMSGPVRRQRPVILKIAVCTAYHLHHFGCLLPCFRNKLLSKPTRTDGGRKFPTCCEWMNRMVDYFSNTHLFRLDLRRSAPISQRAQNEPNQTKKPTFSFHQSLTRFCTNCAGLIERLPFLSFLHSMQGPAGRLINYFPFSPG